MPAKRSTVQYAIFFCLCLFLSASMALADTLPVKIGVLAQRGPDRCLERWSLTADYVGTRVPGKTFTIIPIGFDQLHSMVETSKVDFILTNPAFYVDLEKEHGISRIATLKNRVQDEVYTTYGSVIFCRAQRKDIRRWSDLKGKTVMAVNETSFGGWIMAYRELKEAGIDPYTDFASLKFGGTPDAVVTAVQQGRVDVGIVGTDILERMAEKGNLQLTDFYVTHGHGGGNVHLPFLHSTRTYPEWPMAKLAHTANELAEQVADALIDMPKNSAAAMAAQSGGWTIPLNYQDVHECLKELRLAPYKEFGKFTLRAVFQKYGIWISLNFMILVVLAGLLVNRIRLNRKIKTGQKILEQEISERKKTERILEESRGKYRLLVDNARDGIFIAQDDRIIFPNPRIEELTGYSADTLSRIPLTEIIHPDDREMITDRHKRRLAGETIDSIYNFKLIHQSGAVCTVQINSVLTQWENRPAALCFIRDITAFAEMENQLAQSRKMEAIGTLAGGIAHDFNNVLYPIIGFAEMSIDDLPENHPIRENLDDILAGAKRARDLVRQILTFSRQEESKKQPMLIRPVIKETVRLMRASIPANIEIRQDVEGEPEYISGDITQIHEIIMNLCTNAYHAMAQTGGTMTIGLKRDVPGPDLNLPAGEYCCLSVTDTGTGIAPEIIPRIFDPHFTTKEVGKGSGMGLSVLHGIVENHNGGISVESELGRGSAFKVFFPLVSIESDPQKDSADQQTVGGDETILFVDDEPAIVKLGVRVLERYGYTVMGKESSAQALEVFQSDPDRVDLVITDMEMPGMVGTQLAKKMIQIRPDMPILISTGFSEDLDPDTLADHGIKGCINKPILISDITAAVRTVLDQTKKR